MLVHTHQSGKNSLPHSSGICAPCGIVVVLEGSTDLIRLLRSSRQEFTLGHLRDWAIRRQRSLSDARAAATMELRFEALITIAKFARERGILVATIKEIATTTGVPVGKMTKTQIIKLMAEKLEIAPKQVQAFFDMLAETATQQTRESGEFTVPGLGKLVKVERKERMGRNPSTGEEIKIAAKTTVKFRIAKAASDAIALPKA
jgi:DNA-binding protein HU-beta